MSDSSRLHASFSQRVAQAGIAGRMLLLLVALVLFAVGCKKKVPPPPPPPPPTPPPRAPPTPAAPVINSFTAEPIYCRGRAILHLALVHHRRHRYVHQQWRWRGAEQRTASGLPQGQRQLHADRAWAGWNGFARRYGGSDQCSTAASAGRQHAASLQRGPVAAAGAGCLLRFRHERNPHPTGVTLSRTTPPC